ncbi:hypothetical protein HMPREF9278_0280 [Mobiluncus mulieris FB024-16]|nr:hypothetical protein HMPREF0577_0072 [Mobiluncus mulieris ATCC 35243]EFN92771.1 hypothetical protein HMPREF9278_0280 [Mobiluncus mulieris FB024-16]
MAPHEPDFYRHIWLRSHFHLESEPVPPGGTTDLIMSIKGHKKRYIYRYLVCFWRGGL